MIRREGYDRSIRRERGLGDVADLPQEVQAPELVDERADLLEAHAGAVARGGQPNPFKVARAVELAQDRPLAGTDAGRASVPEIDQQHEAFVPAGRSPRGEPRSFHALMVPAP